MQIVNTQTQSCMSSVYEAATNNQITKLRGLLSYGHAVNEPNENGWTPLCSAVHAHASLQGCCGSRLMALCPCG